MSQVFFCLLCGFREFEPKDIQIKQFSTHAPYNHSLEPQLKRSGHLAVAFPYSLSLKPRLSVWNAYPGVSMGLLMRVVEQD